jgi:propionyl-CoA carboxylase alpha chain
MLENTERKYIRMDSGVAEGHIVTPHYDPMLSKIISYAPTRQESIDGLTQALDEYVIEGVQHNARLAHAVLKHPSFQAGDTPTSFLPTHYPDGFHGVDLSRDEQGEFAVAAAVIGARRREWLQQPPLTGSSVDGNAVVVRLGGLFGPAYRVVMGVGVAAVQALENNDELWKRSIGIDGPGDFVAERHLAHVSLDGTMRSIQVLREETTGEIRMQMYGSDVLVLIQSEREYELSAHMNEPIHVDTSDSVLSPMPGTLISYAVQEGDEVQAGQELCIVEAMKMQNIIRSPRVGRIASCKVDVGSSLKSDEIIMEFEPKADPA